jgi:hypothetical protein
VVHWTSICHLGLVVQDLVDLFATAWLVERCEPAKLVSELLLSCSAVVVAEPATTTTVEARLGGIAAAIHTAMAQACAVVHVTSSDQATMFSCIKDFPAAVGRDVIALTANCGLNDAEVKLLLPWLQSAELWPVAVHSGLSTVVATVNVSSDVPTSTSVQASVHAIVSLWLEGVTEKVAIIARNALASVESPREIVGIRRAVHEACGTADQHHTDTVVYEFLLNDPQYSLWDALFHRHITDAACTLITASFQTQIAAVKGELATQCHHLETAILSAKQDVILNAPLDVSVTCSDVVGWYNTSIGDGCEDHGRLSLDAAVDVTVGLQSSLAARIAVAAWSIAQCLSKTVSSATHVIRDVFPDAPAASAASGDAEVVDDPVTLARAQMDGSLQEFVRALEGFGSEHGRRAVNNNDGVKAYIGAWVCALLSRVCSILADEHVLPSECRSQLQRVGLQCAACWCHALSHVVVAEAGAATKEFLFQQADGSVHGHAVVSVPISGGDDAFDDGGAADVKGDDVEVFRVPAAPTPAIARLLSTLSSCLLAADAVWITDGDANGDGNVDEWGMPMRGRFTGKNGSTTLRGLLSAAHSSAGATVHKTNEASVQMAASLTYFLAIEAIRCAVLLLWAATVVECRFVMVCVTEVQWKLTNQGALAPSRVWVGNSCCLMYKCCKRWLVEPLPRDSSVVN